MLTQDLSGSTAIVTGASRGLGRGVAGALSLAGAQVIGVARDRTQLDEVRAELGESFTPVVADAADPVVAGQLIDAYQPRTIALNAGARPLTRPIHQHTWETFSCNWHVDVQQVFNWTREALLRPLVPGNTVIAFSSGAAVAGSPLSGGYAGAKASIRFIASYAATESERAELGIKFTAVRPQLTPATDLGAAGVAAYAARQGLDLATALERFGPALTPEQVGKAIVELATDPNLGDTAYLLTTAGLATAS
ncbi:SDR family oxidoreductase [Kribbella pittospori]|uniref:SDR family oxidoreductase n=1 Tax=Kribbella pittospori TaxID=722689 RepID=A0A4R0K8N6_9ACTN|nr:SDR family oxidoreductase [Kribbella pittospori]TCC55294.1 SDR family oxidoreductase [Kribbella pittospori]